MTTKYQATLALKALLIELKKLEPSIDLTRVKDDAILNMYQNNLYVGLDRREERYGAEDLLHQLFEELSITSANNAPQSQIEDF